MSQTVQDTTDTITQKAKEAGSTAAEQAKGQLDSRSTDAGEQLHDRADSLRAAGDQMRDRGDDTFAQVADRVAGWTEDLSRYLRDSDADQMLGDVESFARRQPWAVAVGGLVLGFAASRVVRAGSERRTATGTAPRDAAASSARDTSRLADDYGPTYAGTEDRYVAAPVVADPIDLTDDLPVPGTTPGYSDNPAGTGTAASPFTPRNPSEVADPDDVRTQDWNTGGAHVER